MSQLPGDMRDLEISMKKLLPQSRLATDRLIFLSGYEAGLASRTASSKAQPFSKWLAAIVLLFVTACTTWMLLPLRVVWESSPKATTLEASTKKLASPDFHKISTMITTRSSTKSLRKQDNEMTQYSLVSMGRRMRESDDGVTVDEFSFDQFDNEHNANSPTDSVKTPTIYNLQQAISRS